jgi:hypothetical protein
LIGEPDPSDEVQRRRDKCYNVLYACDFPSGDTELDPTAEIVYLNKETWTKDMYREIQRSDELDDLERQKAMEDDILEAQESEVGQMLKEMNIGLDDPALFGALQLIRSHFVLNIAMGLARCPEKPLEGPSEGESKSSSEETTE